jgi:hypothetical protein
MTENLKFLDNSRVALLIPFDYGVVVLTLRFELTKETN